MPRPFVLSLDGREFEIRIVKIDREKLYGRVEIEAFDEKKNPAQLLVLAPDGKTLIDKGGTALATVDENGESISRADLVAVDEDGQKIETVPSSFTQVNVLKRAKIEDYLSQLVKSVYVIEAVDQADAKYLQDHLAAGLIYNFDFSVPEPLETVFISWFQGGEVFRSGMTWRRGLGNIFYFRPGHETYPTYHDANVGQVLRNAVNWAYDGTRHAHLMKAPNTPVGEAIEKIEERGAKLSAADHAGEVKK